MTTALPVATSSPVEVMPSFNPFGDAGRVEVSTGEEVTNLGTRVAGAASAEPEDG